jgi:DnaK suppressor protein
MNHEHYRQLLLAKKKELESELTKTDLEVLESENPGVQDEMDVVVNKEAKESIGARSTQSWQLLKEVRAALQRIEDGTYGQCLEDGGPIEPKRLEAVPWASYCLKHQAKRDAKAPPSATL